MIEVPQWCPLRTRSRHEKRVCAQFYHQGASVEIDADDVVAV